MLTRLNNIKESLVASYWFVPALMSATASAAAVGALRLDARPSGSPFSAWHSWLNVNTAEGARALLSTIAGSTITLAGVIFSITVLALSFASSQYGPRLLRSFMRDRASQLVLGTFVSTYLYSLLVLRTIGSREEEIVPHTAVAGALVLGLLSMAVLIFFIHHVARAIQVASVIDAVGQDMDRLVEEFLSRCDAAPRVAPANRTEAPRIVTSTRTGYVQALATEELLDACRTGEAAVELLVSPGDYVGPTFPLAAVRAKRWSNEADEQIRTAVVIGVQRTSEQDLEFPIDQLAEIGVRALSPSLNDPFTAVHCIKRLAASFAPLFASEWPHGFVCDEGGVPLITLRATTPQRVLQRAYDQIIHYGESNPMILRQVMKALCYLHQVAKPEHAAVIKRYADDLMVRTSAKLGAASRDSELNAFYRQLGGPADSKPKPEQ